MSFTIEEFEDIKQLLVASNGVLMADLDKLLGEKLDAMLNEKLGLFAQRLGQKAEYAPELVLNDQDDMSNMVGSQLANNGQLVAAIEQAEAV